MYPRILVALFFLCAATPSWGEAIRYTCSYPIFANLEGLRKASDFSMEFTYDTLTGDAFMVGNNGTSKVFAQKGSEAITFLEPLPSGAVQVTIVDENGSSAHSRHSIIIGDLVPSQYYGTCERS